jgi:predicted dehydrogenase
VRTLLIGLGRIGMGYDLDSPTSDHKVRTHAKAFSQHEGFTLVGAVDPDESLREAFTLHYRLPAFESVFEALEEVNPEIAVIATPTDTHQRVLNQVLTAKSIAAVLCEKPLAPSSQEAMEMRNHAETRGVRLFVNYIRRSTPGAALIREALHSGRIPGPFRGVAVYSNGLLHNGTHAIDLLQYWFGEPLKVGRLGGDDPGLSPLYSPDAILRYEHAEIYLMGRTSGSLELNMVQLAGPNDALAFGALGSFFIEVTGEFSESLKELYERRSVESRLIPIGLEDYQHHAANALFKALNHGDVQLTTASEAVLNLQVIETILSEGI